MFLYISLAAFLTVGRAGNEDSVVGPEEISVVFISTSPPTINQSQWTRALFAETQSLPRHTVVEGLYRDEPDLRSQSLTTSPSTNEM